MEDTVQIALSNALSAYEGIEHARQRHRQRVVEFIDIARRNNWTWQEIGKALGVTDTGARRFYFRNRGRLAQT
jgi:hypothetical protein